ncbi:MAG: amidohydrolase family protein [Burkholderiaceae bacterium]
MQTETAIGSEYGRIENVTIVTPGEPVQRDMTIEWVDGVISAIAPMSVFQVPPGRSLDTQGAVCIPGLVNTHNHTPLTIVRGMVEDLGFAPAYTPGIPQGHWLSEEQTLALSRLGALELLCAGCTTFVDYYRQPAALAKAAIESGQRAFVGGRVMNVDSGALASGRFETDRALGDSTLREALDMIEAFDGAGDGRITGIHAPHAGDTCSADLLSEIARLASADGRQVHTHLAQSPLELKHIDARDGCGPVRLLADAGLLTDKLFAAHCIFLDEEEIVELGRAQATVCHAPLGNAAFGALAPIKALRDAGATITLCTDTKSADMFESMRMALAAARIRADGEFVFDADLMLSWATCDGASALGMSDVGRIQEGYRADLVVLDALAANLRPVVDGTGIVVHSGSASNVQHVFVDGERLVANGQPTRLDAQDVIDSAQSVADELWARARHA